MRSHLRTQATMTTTHNIEIPFQNKCNYVENVSEWTDYGYYMVIVIGYLFQRLLAVSTMILSSDCHFMHCVMNIRRFLTLQHVSFV